MLKIAVISPSKNRLEEIRHIMQGADATWQILLFDDGVEQLALVAENEHPDLVIIDRIYHGTKELEDLEVFCTHYTNIALVILSENATSEFFMAAIRAGVRDVLHLPLVPEALVETVKRIENKLKPTATPKKIGRVVAFVAGKGGGGTTFLACNLAYILAVLHGVKVALLDINLQFGDAALFVSDQVPSNTLADVAGNISRLDASFLASSMVQVLPNFLVLAAPEDAERAMEVKPEHIESLLKLAKTQYDYVILDVGQTLNATSVKAFDHADQIFLVLQETLPFIRDSKRLLHALQSLGYGKEKIQLILNRYETGGDIQLEDVEATLGMKVFTTIPNSYEAVSSSVNQGVPIMKIAKNDPVTKALQEMAQKMTEKAPAKKGGWLANFLQSA
jgi:pilus assembly protein CpaE